MKQAMESFMRVLGISLAVLTMALTSGGVAFEQTLESGVGMSMSPAEPVSGDESLPVCGAPPEGPTLTIIEMPPLDLLERQRGHRVRSLSATGFNQLPHDRWRPEAPITPPPAAPAN